MIYLHIPKTAGTALKSLNRDGYNFFDVCSSHQDILTTKHNVIFGVRDPIERFCSGFWEAKTLHIRKQLSEKNENSPYRIGSYKLLNNMPQWYVDVQNNCNDPNEYILHLRNNSITRNKLFEFNTTSTYNTHTPLGIVGQSLVWWLGELENYKKNEHRVNRAVNTKSLSKYMKDKYNIDMPTEPFKARSRKQFDIPQSYNISADNKKWFTEEFRAKDYELIDYIKNQKYYYE